MRRIWCFTAMLTLAASALGAEPWKPANGPLMTRWAKDVSPEKVWPEYPRPQMVRGDWQNLNGLWDLAIVKKEDPQPEKFDRTILVPFPVESALSSVMQLVEPSQRVWYRRTFKLPEKWNGQRILLHFEAVDWDTTVYLNGKEIGQHKGCYDPFTFDITDQIKSGAEQTLVLSVWDPTNEGGQPLGKQTLAPGGCFYTRSTGIWQTVWLEAVPQTYISGMKLIPDIDKGELRLVVQAQGAADAAVEAVASAEGKTIATAKGKAGEEIRLPIANARLWTPDSPFLYDLKITLTAGSAKDEVGSYFGMRKIAVGPDEKGITRILLNNKFVFQVGPLDQGFWPEGLHTPPTDEAMRYDLEMTKKYGFNMVRKHIKVEPARWYYWCDKLGLAVWQDMPAMPLREVKPEAKAQYALELERMIGHLYNSPSIVMWVPFNEAWGQHDTEKTVESIRRLDPTRIINNASGWIDQKVGDILDHHTYPVPGSPRPEAKRAAVIGEYGGLGYKIPEHSWNKSGWGYDVFENFEQLNTAYEGLCDVLQKRIENPGISGAVYTQTTDIETEINGLMTYDREVFKIDPAWSNPALRGGTPPRKTIDTPIFIGEGRVELACVREGAEIRYTLDGSEPTKQSAKYEGAITLSADATVKARAFWADGLASRIVSYPMKKVAPIAADKPEGAKPGLQVCRYELKGDDINAPTLEALKPVSAAISNQPNLTRAIAKEGHALRFDGWVTVPTTGVYVFHIAADDRASLTVAGQEIVADRVSHGLKFRNGAIALEAGPHPIRIEFFQGSGNQDLRLEWTPPGATRAEVPAAAFTHRKTVAMQCMPPAYGAPTPLFVGQVDATLTCPYADAKIRYTLDGSEPGESSPLYERAIRVEKNVTIKARAYADEMTPSEVRTFDLQRVEPVAAVRAEVEPGLKASWFQLAAGVNRMPDFAKLTAARTFIAPTLALSGADEGKQYGIVFDGYIDVPATGVYAFSLSADDEARLIVAGKTLVERSHWTDAGGPRSGYIALSAGLHPIQVLYYQESGGQRLDLRCTGPKGNLPAEAFRHGK